MVGGETDQEVWLRIKSLVDQILSSKDDRVLIVAHNGTIHKLILMFLMLKNHRDPLSGEFQDLYKEIPKILNVSLTTVQVQLDQGKITSVELESDN